MNYIQFTLSMPNVGSWNDKWSGSSNFYAVVRKFSESKTSKEKIKKLLDNKS